MKIATLENITITSREIAELNHEGYTQPWTHPKNNQTYRECALPTSCRGRL